MIKTKWLVRTSGFYIFICKYMYKYASELVLMLSFFIEQSLKILLQDCVVMLLYQTVV